MRITQFFTLALALSSLTSCNGTLDISMQQKETGVLALQLQSDVSVSSLLMQSFEDLDLLRDNTDIERELPSIFEESIAFIRPYTSLAQVQKLGRNRVGFRVEMDDLVGFSSQLQQGGLGLITLRKSAEAKTILRFAMGAGEQQILADILPTLPSRWTAATRKEYLSALANILAHTRSDRMRLEQELSEAVFLVSLNLSDFSSPVRVSTQDGVMPSTTQPLQVAINMVDFLSGHAWLELEW